jgi:hypothetical protein
MGFRGGRSGQEIAAKGEKKRGCQIKKERPSSILNTLHGEETQLLLCLDKRG